MTTNKKKLRRKRGRERYGKMLDQGLWKSAEGIECKIVRFDGQPIQKAMDELGLLFGWASVCKDAYSDRPDGDHVDRHRDRMDEDGLLKAALRWVDRGAMAKAMHRGRQVGDVPFVFPLMEDIKKALGLEGPYTGLIVGMRPNAQTLAKFKSGELTCFSIGGRLRNGFIE